MIAFPAPPSQICLALDLDAELFRGFTSSEIFKVWIVLPRNVATGKSAPRVIALKPSCQQFSQTVRATGISIRCLIHENGPFRVALES